MTNADIILLKQIQQGDKEAIKSLYHLAYNDCKSVVMLHNGSEKDARNLFKEAVLTFIKNSQKPGFQLSSSPKDYLYTICQDLWLKQLPSSKSDTSLPKQELNTIGDIIGDSIEKMGADCKEILISFYYKKMSIKEIADKMNTTIASIKIKKKKYVDAIKSQLEQ